MDETTEDKPKATESESESEPQSRDWGDMTHECLTNIMGRLGPQDLWVGPMVACKAWLEACQDSSLHSSFDLDSSFDLLTESPQWWSSEFQRRVDSMLRSAVTWSHGSLLQVRTRHCSNHSVSFVADRCPNLEVLSIKSCPNVTDSSIIAVALRCSLLRELDISYCYEITVDALELVGRHCQNLKIFKRNLLNWLDPSQHIGIVPEEYLNACPQDGDPEAAVIGKYMPRLEHLEIRFSKITSKGLVSISEGCLDLKYLDLFGCANLTSRDIVNASNNLKKLKQIKRPNFYIPRSVFHSERYGHWRLYDERFQTDVFRI